MKLEIDELPRIAVLKVKGRLVGDECEPLVAAAQELLEQGIRLLVVDLRDSKKMDSDGIGTLIQTFTKFAKQCGKIVLVMPDSFFDNRLSSVYPIFETYRSQEEAIDALLDLGVVPDRIDSEAERKIAWVYRETESQKEKASRTLKLGRTFFFAGAALFIIGLALTTYACLL